MRPTLAAALLFAAVAAAVATRAPLQSAPAPAAAVAAAVTAAGLAVAPPAPTLPPPATLLFALYAEAADLDVPARRLILKRASPALLWVSVAAPRRAGRVRTSLWANASLWTGAGGGGGGGWLGSPPAVLEGLRAGASRPGEGGAAVPLRLSAPVYDARRGTLTLAVDPLAPDAPDVLEGGVVATALDTAAGAAVSTAGGGARPPVGALPAHGKLSLTDAVLYVDAAPAPPAPPTAGAKQTAFAGCAGVPLGTLSSFGGSCGFYDASQLGGGQLGWGTGFGGGMLLGSGTFG